MRFIRGVIPVLAAGLGRQATCFVLLSPSQQVALRGEVQNKISSSSKTTPPQIWFTWFMTPYSLLLIKHGSSLGSDCNTPYDEHPRWWSRWISRLTKEWWYCPSWSQWLSGAVSVAGVDQSTTAVKWIYWCAFVATELLLFLEQDTHRSQGPPAWNASPHSSWNYRYLPVKYDSGALQQGFSQNQFLENGYTVCYLRYHCGTRCLVPLPYGIFYRGTHGTSVSGFSGVRYGARRMRYNLRVIKVKLSWWRFERTPIHVL